MKQGILGIMLVWMLTACGFHLRGLVQMPDYLQPVYLNVTSASLKQEFRRAFRLSKVKLTGNAKQAKLVIKVRNEKFSRRVLSVGSTGKAKEYELNYQVTYQLIQKEKQWPEDTIQQTHDYLFDETDVLGQAQQEKILQQGMNRQAVELILRKIRVLLSR